jgi:hypothetical protein
MENKFLLANNYNPFPDYKLSNYIDVKDSVDHWCVGQIVDIDEEKNLVKVHFEGWSTRYDEVSTIHTLINCAIVNPKRFSQNWTI